MIHVINKPQHIIERGDIYFFYRPRVEPLQEDHKVTGFNDVQRFYIVLHPEDNPFYRLLVVGKKRMPIIDYQYEKNWAMVDLITRSYQELLEELAEKIYHTKTQGDRKSPAARPCGKGVYALIYQSGHSHLLYTLTLPEKPGEVQHELDIYPQASYVISVKNQNIAGSHDGMPVHFPKRLSNKFGGRRFVPLDTPELLNYEGTELLLIGASTDIYRELGIDRDKIEHTIDTTEIMEELAAWKEQRLVVPLLKGRWR